MGLLRFSTLILAVLMAAAACGGDDTETSGDSSTTDTTSTDSSRDEVTSSTSTGGDPSTTETVDDADVSSPTTATPPASDSTTTTADDASATGTVNVSLEPVEGFFIEGFEVGLRFETTTGEVIDATLWSDVVDAIANPSIDDYYGAVHAQPVPAGKVVVLATVSIGAGPPPIVPDLRGPMQCELTVDVPAGGEVDVEVAFDQQDCLTEK